MERRQLECLVAVVNAGSFHQAAEKLFVTQSAVSQAIKALESELGEPLLIRPVGRGGGGLRTSAAGAIFLPIASDILRRFEEGRQAVADLGGLLLGRLNIGAVDVAAMYHLPGPLRTFNNQHPQLEISVRIAGSATLTRELQAGKLDLAFVLGSDTPAGLSGQFYREDPLCAVGPSTLIRDLGRRPGPRKIAQQGWITYPRGSVSRGIIERAFRKAELPFPVLMEIDRPEAILKLVKAGLGLAILPRRLVDSALPDGDLLRLSLSRLRASRPIRVLHRSVSALAPSARSFLGTVAEHG